MVPEKGYYLRWALAVIAFMTANSLSSKSPLNPPESLLSQRPGVNGEPTEVLINFALVDIHEVIDANQLVEISLAVFISWKDPTLAHSGKQSIHYAPESIWTPGLTIFNASQLNKEEDRRLEVTPDGIVHMEEVYRGKLYQSFNLKDFPLDKQQLRITLVSPGNRPDEVILKQHPKIASRISPKFSLPDWSIENWSVESYLLQFTEDAPGRYIYNITLDAHRSSRYYFLKVIIPLVLIMGMSWLVYWIHPSNVETQVGMGATSMLSLIAFRFTIDQVLPEIPYLTRLDLFILLAMIMVFSSLAESVTTGHLFKNGREKLAIKIDSYGRWIYLILLLGVILFSLVL